MKAGRMQMFHVLEFVFSAYSIQNVLFSYCIIYILFRNIIKKNKHGKYRKRPQTHTDMQYEPREYPVKYRGQRDR